MAPKLASERVPPQPGACPISKIQNTQTLVVRPESGRSKYGCSGDVTNGLLGRYRPFAVVVLFVCPFRLGKAAALRDGLPLTDPARRAL